MSEPMFLLLVLVSLVAGFLAAFFYTKASSLKTALVEARQSLVLKEEELNALRKQLMDEITLKTEYQTRLEEHQKNMEFIEGEVKNTFRLLSSEALKANVEEFLRYAGDLVQKMESKFSSLSQETKTDLETKRQLIEKTVENIEKALAELRLKVEEVDKGTVQVGQLIKEHEKVTLKLQDTTQQLSQALASPKARGAWGERLAEDIIAAAGLKENFSYVKQKATDQGKRRPDFTFLLPNGLKVNMDVKFPLDNYQKYLLAENELEKVKYKSELLRNAKAMIKDITTRDYIDPSNNTLDFVLLFIPNEQLFNFLNESDPKFLDDALKQRVLVCSPITLYSILLIIRQASQNFSFTKKAKEIIDLVIEFEKQWDNFKVQFEDLGNKILSLRSDYERLSTTRFNALERPMRRIQLLKSPEESGGS